MVDIEPEVVLAGLGAYVLFKFALKALGSIYKAFLRPGKNLKKLGKWAVITGATDGIGKAYAKALAKKGISIVLISRTESKLQDVKKEIDDKGYDGVETKYVVCDYSKFDKAAQAKVEAEIKDLEVGVLINNVGVSYPYPKYFHELSDDQVYNLIEMNINSTTWMTRMVLGGMVERKKGTIVNISSASGLITCPLLAEYSASKGFVEKFSRALNAEYASKGITCQCQAPFYVATKLAKKRKSFDTPTPDEYAAVGMKWIGQSDSVVSPFWFHSLMAYVMSLLPDSFVTSQTMSMHLAIRKRGMKKEAEKAKAAKKE